jgi:cytochrome c-type biogenesis protein
MDFSLVIPAFVAGILTFLAPCTLPLAPAYLSFISGASAKDLADPTQLKTIRRKVVLNGLFYVLGFSIVFILLGVVFGIGGLALAKYQAVLSQIGGGFIIIFGLYLMHIFDLSFLNFLQSEKRFNVAGKLKPGNPLSSTILGITFALGWTPCVGPILASILFLASSTATVFQGAFLLAVFSLGLAVPFMALAFGVGHAVKTVQKLSKILPYISFIGGAFLLFLGILLVTGKMSIWLAWAFKAFSIFDYDAILNLL